ncbi:feline leukemia virus subgroup c receptor-related protein 2 [Stylonychia lemnae]|uniref:Feline leukemia virus subgroup c receptor-related protein 2 n=1 Tax=Stylonychia lemnae TaxID=5949 RepID=A0A078B5B5_STYLE|nr:feline leukemia virus subgroup c receptor-related protein 2 [Stylonychia lemnae]|eukprot:CDW89720.1 feline leukemia virus subgroup c receptor-related protein 2 [Stylonychia lemnae]
MDSTQAFSLNQEDNEQFIHRNSDQQKRGDQGYGKSPIRFAMLIMVMLAFLINQNCYDLNNIGTPDYLYYVEPFYYLIFFLMSVKWIEEWGLYRTFCFALIIQTFALWFGRSLNEKVFQTDLVGPTVGELLNSLAQVLIFNSITKVTSSWFDHRERIIATGLILIAFHFGNLTTQYYLNHVPTDESKPIDWQYENFRYYLEAYWLGLAIVNFGLFLLFAFFFRHQPDKMPSKSQTDRHKPFNFHLQIGTLLQDKNVKIIYEMCTFFLIYIFSSPYNFRWYIFEEAVGNEFNVVREEIQPYLYMAGILITSILITYKPNYKMALAITIIGNMLFTFIGELGYLITNKTVFFIGYCAQGFFNGALKLIVYELITEISFPVSAGLSIACLHVIAKPCILAVTLVSDQSDDAYQGTDAINHIFNDIIQFVYLVGLAICLVLVAKVDLKTKRLDVDLLHQH